ncbi:MAG: EF-hand domain-containing protein [Alphaproteobacteria bacterium]|nr:EF-hand domain-containing protein [Alphaproteobacteria bacterium]
MRKKSLSILLATLLIGTGAGTLHALAQGGPPQGERPDPAEMYSKMDANGDGCVSLSEFQDARPSGGSGMGNGGMGRRSSQGGDSRMGNPGDMFEKLDKNGDGVLSKEEFSSGRPPR